MPLIDRHLADGVLRHLYDDPLALTSHQRLHYAGCAACRSRFAQIAAGARATAELLVTPVRTDGSLCEATIDMAAALASVRRRSAAENNVAPLPRSRYHYERIVVMLQIHSLLRPLIKSIGGLAAAAALVGVLALTPAGSLAQSFLTIFQPKQFVALPVTLSDLQSLPNLSQYGSVTQNKNGNNDQVVSSAAAAARLSGLTVAVPSSLPATVPSTVTYEVLSQRSGTFTFSAAKAAAAAAKSGKNLPPMPANLDGSVLNVTVGPVVLSVYHGASVDKVTNTSSDAATATKMGALKRQHAARRVDGGTVVQGVSSTSEDSLNLPSLVVAEAPLPTVASTGATVQQIEDYLLAQPGISPSLAADIRAIGDPTSTMPVPLPVNLASGQPVQVQGVTGLEIGDNTGLGSAIIWHKDGMVYAVGGTLTADQVLAIANGLH